MVWRPTYQSFQIQPLQNQAVAHSRRYRHRRRQWQPVSAYRVGYALYNYHQALSLEKKIERDGIPDADW